MTAVWVIGSWVDAGKLDAVHGLVAILAISSPAAAGAVLSIIRRRA